MNTSRAFTVMVRHWVNNDAVMEPVDEDRLVRLRKELVHRHVAWLHALTLEMRKLKDWARGPMMW
ncbi:MAG: hypothetical protein R2818_10120 [Flavobacteriales bacterium]